VAVDNGVSLLDRGLAGQDAGGKSRGHRHQADGFQARVQVGWRVAGGEGGRT